MTPRKPSSDRNDIQWIGLRQIRVERKAKASSASAQAGAKSS